MDRHSELELKFGAGGVELDKFNAFCMALNPIRFESAAFPDVYYRRGENVVRHRLIKGAGELTVKRRKNANDITDRREVDLRFDPSMTAGDVAAFLWTAGWEQDLVLSKEFSRVFWFKHSGATIAVSLYEVSYNFDVRRFLEVEVEKTSDVSPEEAARLLRLWGGVVADEFDAGPPLDESLYEMYSGRRYLSV